MLVYRCDGCSREIEKHDLRYTVKIDVRAAYDQFEIGLADLMRDHRTELLALIERLKNKKAEEIEETVYKSLTLDLCPACQKAYIRDPLRFHPEQGAAVDDEINIDDFLQSLGFGEKPLQGDTPE